MSVPPPARAGSAAVALVLLLAGCGGQETVQPVPADAGPAPSPSQIPTDDAAAPTDTVDDETTPPPAEPAGSADLTITVDTSGTGETTVWTLTCDPPGGNHPDPEQACATLASTGVQPLQPDPEDQVCTEQYGGPEEATIEGTYDGEPVEAELTRSNGCEISRWEALQPLLQPVS